MTSRFPRTETLHELFQLVGIFMIGTLLMGEAAGSRESTPAGGTATPPATAAPLSKSVAAALQRDGARCRRNADVDACYDALRRHPDDAALLMALGDALMRGGRPMDAVRNYRRAAALAPTLRGLAAKISAAESRPRQRRSVADTVATQRYSNMAPETESH
jgi:hypothetical protein